MWAKDNCWPHICLPGAKPLFPNPNPNLGRWVLFWCMEGVALTSSALGLSLNGLKKKTAEGAEEALLQKAEALAEVTPQGKG